MNAEGPTGPYRFLAPDPSAEPRGWVRVGTGSGPDWTIPFSGRLEIGRHQEGKEPAPGELRIDDPAVSRRHCVLVAASGMRCTLRDTSRNGTWLDGRRLVPNLEVDVNDGQVISLGRNHQIEVRIGAARTGEHGSTVSGFGTMDLTSTVTVTVLVGDIREYTSMVQHLPAVDLQRSVARVFERLERAVRDLGGVVKEYPGDAVFAFWEGRDGVNHAEAACRAALALDRLSRDLAADPRVWGIGDFPLRMDWALATGSVVIKSLGGDHPTGLSMVGEPVVLAFRLEKMADDASGPVLACERTVCMMGDGFHIRDLGRVGVEGFEAPQRAYAVLGERDR